MGPRIYLIDYNTRSDDRVTVAMAFATVELARAEVGRAVAAHKAAHPKALVTHTRYRVEVYEATRVTTYHLYSLAVITDADAAVNTYRAELMIPDEPEGPGVPACLTRTARIGAPARDA